MKKFLKGILLAFTIALVCIALFGLVVAGIISSLRDKTPTVKKGSILVFDMSVNITDGPAGFNAQEAVQGALMGSGSANSVQLYPLLRSLEHAATDDRITGLFMHGSLIPVGYGTGYGALRELREALQKFKHSGKPIYAYLVGPSTKDYYLASTATSVALHPRGIFMLNGLVGERMYYAGALEKYGIGVQVVRVGKYKSYVEPFIRTNMSPESREQTAQLLGVTWEEIIQAIAAERKLEPTQIQTWVDKAEGVKPEDALSRKLVDKLAYFDEQLAELKKLSGQTKEGEPFPQVDLVSYATVAKKSDKKSANKIAVIYAEGGIEDGEGGPGTIGGDSLARRIRKLRGDKSVKAIVLRVNSPGGSATASDVIDRELTLAKTHMPVVVSMGTVAASGGYWISARSSHIFAEPNTITGSIGILGMIPNFQVLANRHGLTWDSVKTGKYADVLGYSRPKNPEEMALFQDLINDGYDKFLELVASGRNKSKEAVNEIAQGRVWSGKDALKVGLVDELGGLRKAIDYAAESAKLGTDWSVLELPEEKPLLEQLSEILGGEKKPVTKMSPFTSLLRELGAEVQTLRSLNDPAGMYALMPEVIRIK